VIISNHSKKNVIYLNIPPIILLRGVPEDVGLVGFGAGGTIGAMDEVDASGLMTDMVVGRKGVKGFLK